MTQLTIQELQDYLALKYQDTLSSSAAFMKLVEEIGEVAEVLNMMEGRKAGSEDRASLAKELADVIHYTVAIASHNDIDLTQVIFEKDAQASVKYGQVPDLRGFLAQ